MFPSGRLMFKEAVNEIRLNYVMSNGNEDFLPSQYPYWCLWKKIKTPTDVFQLFVYEILQLLHQQTAGRTINYEKKTLNEIQVTKFILF